MSTTTHHEYSIDGTDLRTEAYQDCVLLDLGEEFGGLYLSINETEDLIDILEAALSDAEDYIEPDADPGNEEDDEGEGEAELVEKDDKSVYTFTFKPQQVDSDALKLFYGSANPIF